ncbi:circadian clock protein KaiC, partial [Candidatus Woesearchaeota archaeon CG10_big_fil_rev_8_21_14_0_10_30_7]
MKRDLEVLYASLQQKTGISGFDEVLNGGIPKYSLILLSGTSGSGKTILSFQWLFNGAKQGENGLYISITEPLFMAVRNIESMKFYDRKIIEQEKIKLFDIKEDLDYEKIEPHSILSYIEQKVKETNAKRIVIDSITAILYALNDQSKIAHFLFELKKILATLGCTTILISKVTDATKYSSYSILELIPDGVFSLTNTVGENQIVKKLQVIKMR